MPSCLIFENTHYSSFYSFLYLSECLTLLSRGVTDGNLLYMHSNSVTTPVLHNSFSLASAKRDEKKEVFCFSMLLFYSVKVIDFL